MSASEAPARARILSPRNIIAGVSVGAYMIPQAMAYGSLAGVSPSLSLSIAVVPLALPLMAGPGAISSVIVYASQSHWQQLLGMSVVVVVFSFCSWLIFRAAPLLFKIMGNTGINVVTRIMGLIMMSLGIEIMVAGIKGVFPSLM